MDDRSLLDLLFIVERYCRRRVMGIDRGLAHDNPTSIKELRLRNDYLRLLDSIDDVGSHYGFRHDQDGFLDDLEVFYHEE